MGKIKTLGDGYTADHAPQSLCQLALDMQGLEEAAPSCMSVPHGERLLG